MLVIVKDKSDGWYYAGRNMWRLNEADAAKLDLADARKLPFLDKVDLLDLNRNKVQ